MALYHTITPPSDQRDAAALWQEWHRTGSERSCQALADLYLPLVVQQVERICARLPAHVDRRDLLGAGVLGLQQAIASCDEARQSNFSGYASARIRGSILDELRRIDPLTRPQRRTYHAICAATAILTQRLQQTPTAEQIATETGLSVAKINTHLAMGSTPKSLDEPIDENRRVKDTLADPRAALPSDMADASLSREAMRSAFRQLPERQQQLLYLRLYEGLRVSEIAAVLEISEGRVSQLYNEIVTRLRSLMLVGTTEHARV